jgi:hypothetical protein
MLYPEKWSRGEYDVADPQSQPYDIIFRSLVDFQIQVDRCTGPSCRGFRTTPAGGLRAGPVQAQVQAAADRVSPAGCSGARTRSTASTATQPLSEAHLRWSSWSVPVPRRHRGRIRRFYAAVTAAPWPAVPSCPGWTWRTSPSTSAGPMASGPRSRLASCSRRTTSKEPSRPPADELLAWARERTTHLEAALAQTDPGTTVWTGRRRRTWPSSSVAWPTRQPSIAGCRAGGGRSPADRARAGQRRRGRVPERHAARAPVLVSAHPRLGPPPRHRHSGEWLVREQEDGTLVVTAEHAKGTLRCEAGQRPGAGAVGRVAPDALDVIGDREVATRLLTRTTVGDVYPVVLRLEGGAAWSWAPAAWRGARSRGCWPPARS